MSKILQNKIWISSKIRHISYERNFTKLKEKFANGIEFMGSHPSRLWVS